MHAIDPDQLGGHGALPSDVDGDGDADVVLANADVDTPEDEEVVLWYENPGNGRPEQRRAWPARVIYAGNEFTGKPQLAIAEPERGPIMMLCT